MSEKDGSVSKCEDVSFDGFRPEHAAGFFDGFRKWCFGWKEAGSNTQTFCQKVLYDVGAFQYLCSCELTCCSFEWRERVGGGLELREKLGEVCVNGSGNCFCFTFCFFRLST